ncbi:uncharacterized protein G2W53_007501 [Senna tora]|uniref:Uncharacterized protein n=1 Tax=Senna tora TaxID=362788 RepID=A0A834X6J2_9FABA|nr:uncharacterized protein G2W53_007501 [Senna tora]
MEDVFRRYGNRRRLTVEGWLRDEKKKPETAVDGEKRRRTGRNGGGRGGVGHGEEVERWER